MEHLVFSGITCNMKSLEYINGKILCVKHLEIIFQNVIAFVPNTIHINFEC